MLAGWVRESAKIRESAGAQGGAETAKNRD
jgi:hypothetical protein